jgi:hypothetical protein
MEVRRHARKRRRPHRQTPLPESFVSGGDRPKEQPKAIARATVAVHSAFVGNRRSPRSDPSDKPQIPSATSEAA